MPCKPTTLSLQGWVNHGHSADVHVLCKAAPMAGQPLLFKAGMHLADSCTEAPITAYAPSRAYKALGSLICRGRQLCTALHFGIHPLHLPGQAAVYSPVGKVPVTVAGDDVYAVSRSSSVGPHRPRPLRPTPA